MQNDLYIYRMAFDYKERHRFVYKGRQLRIHRRALYIKEGSLCVKKALLYTEGFFYTRKLLYVRKGSYIYKCASI